MSATQTLNATAQDSVHVIDGNGIAPEPAAAETASKRNGRRHPKTEKPATLNAEISPRLPTGNEEEPSLESSGQPQNPRGEREENAIAAAEALECNGTPDIPPTESDGDAVQVQQLTEIPPINLGNGGKLAVNPTPAVIANIAQEANINFFQDQHGSVFAWVPVKDEEQQHFECLRIRSRPFLSRLLELVKARTESPPQLSTVKQAIDVLELEAYRTPKQKLDNRRATIGDDIFIDLGDEKWRTVRVSRDGWSIENHDEARFFRPQHMLPLPLPEPGGDLDDLFTYVPADTDGDKLLLKAWLLGGLYAAIPNPILLVIGQQGSAKTTRSRRLRSLLDPSITPVLGDLEMSNLFLTFQHHAVPCFENVSSFKRKEADMFCRAVTGNGVERRKLYTDGDQVLYSFRRPIIINGLDSPTTQADFLDRCLTFNCRRIDQFIPLEELDRLFEAARPRLFGAMLDLLVKTLRALCTTPPATEFRMADFARFGRAVAVALGKKPEEFDAVYRMNIEQQCFEILEDAPMARLLKGFASKLKGPWEGTAEELLAKLKNEAHVSGDKEARNDLPKSARWLSGRLGELAPALVNHQVYITKMPRTNAKRLWRITSTIPQDPNAEPEDICDTLAEAGREEEQE